jgi:excisionase family DNA binding protein
MSKAVGEITTESGRVIKGDFLSLKEVAKRVKVNPATILRWIKKKKAKVTPYKNNRGHWMFREEDVQKLKDYKSELKEVTA